MIATASLLEKLVDRFNRPEFIEGDPISVPHRFSKKQDIEIAGFLAATFAWGQRSTIISKSLYLLELMDNSPYDFIINAADTDYHRLATFVHRTFNGDDCMFFINSLKNLYSHADSLEESFFSGGTGNVAQGIKNFRRAFLASPHMKRSEKHISSPDSFSACKRINMFLRWMVRDDGKGVDFGLWKKIKPSELMCPLDVHVANTGRKLGLLNRSQNDWHAVVELTTRLKEFCPTDPVKYDFALFGYTACKGL